MKTLDELRQEAIAELEAEARAEKESGIYNLSDHGVKAFETEDHFSVEQDISAILADVKEEREMRSEGLMKAEKGTRKFATIPLTHIIEYQNTKGIDIMDAETSQNKQEMAKFRMWIESEHPYLMVREKGTRYNKSIAL